MLWAELLQAPKHRPAVQSVVVCVCGIGGVSRFIIIVECPQIRLLLDTHCAAADSSAGGWLSKPGDLPQHVPLHTIAAQVVHDRALPLVHSEEAHQALGTGDAGGVQCMCCHLRGGQGNSPNTDLLHVPLQVHGRVRRAPDGPRLRIRQRLGPTLCHARRLALFAVLEQPPGESIVQAADVHPVPYVRLADGHLYDLRLAVLILQVPLSGRHHYPYLQDAVADLEEHAPVLARVRPAMGDEDLRLPEIVSGPPEDVGLQPHAALQRNATAEVEAHGIVQGDVPFLEPQAVVLREGFGMRGILRLAPLLLLQPFEVVDKVVHVLQEQDTSLLLDVPGMLQGVDAHVQGVAHLRQLVDHFDSGIILHRKLGGLQVHEGGAVRCGRALCGFFTAG
mmetsp:Transcript_27007/g.48651  ORF Transcript_27007/g.48651 Transcript_27007/m.48651 type:complete len:392 (-) Transcript_27007:2235-3410(-)